MSEVAELTRLNKQHDFISSGLGYALHPTIERALQHLRKQTPENLNFADVSIGEAFSDSAPLPFGPQETTVDKVPFETVSGQDDVPEELRSKYNVVCVRLLHASPKAVEWDRCLQNMVAFLKPGGWLQWVDWDPMTARIATVKPGAPDGVLRDLLSDLADTMRAKKVGNTYRISNSMRSYLEEEDSDMYTIDPQVELTKVIASGAIEYLQDCGKYTPTEAEELWQRTNQEIDDAGSLVFYDLWCHIGRKPVK